MTSGLPQYGGFPGSGPSDCPPIERTIALVFPCSRVPLALRISPVRLSACVGPPSNRGGVSNPGEPHPACLKGSLREMLIEFSHGREARADYFERTFTSKPKQ